MKEKLGSNSNGETSHSVIDVEASLAHPQGGGGNRAGLFRTPISGGVQNATSAHALPRPALAVRNLLEQVKGLSFRLLYCSFHFSEKLRKYYSSSLSVWSCFLCMIQG